jgi:hypothetical protein
MPLLLVVCAAPVATRDKIAPEQRLLMPLLPLVVVPRLLRPETREEQSSGS